ncbi:MAG: dihydrolipoyllysine-residue acetyltransferase [Xanthomonadales bacterium]|jgi:pyruvate dehydrogenase E2 component (dihydrolipoamide acetyltransferase)|nr:dihydrolipoyllysine-residue acetyltransferase [Xanthomonadales bacterium]
MAERIEIRVPDIGDFEDVPVIEVLVAVGDTVAAEQSIITLESDKATMEVPAPADGVVASLDVALNDTVSEGDLVGVLTVAAADDAEAEDPAAESEETPDAGGTAPAEAASVEVRVPDIGDFEDVPVIEVLVARGDAVEAEQSLVTLESDKATMEVPAPQAGVVESLAVAVDDTVSEGDLVATLTVTEAAPDKTASAPPGTPRPEADAGPEQTVPTPQAKESPRREPATSAGERQAPPVPLGAERLMPGKVPYASPAIRAFARELGVDLLRVNGSGRKGRILREDVTAFVKSALQGGAAPATGGFEVAPAPKVDFSRFGETETVELSRIKKISGKNLHRNWVTIPHVTHNDLADSTDLEAFRQKHKAEAKAQGFNLTPLAFLMKSVVAALQEYPNFNASLDAAGEALVLKKYYHLGIAVDTPDGLVVPVLRDCDQKSVSDLAKELAEVSQRARDGKLKPADWQGASFSISSLGGIGGTSFSPIINAPEVAILGVSRARREPVWDGEQFQPRLMMPLSLSYDHRVIDGAQAARFCRALAAHIEDTDNLVL